MFRLLPVNPGPNISAEAVEALAQLPLHDAALVLATLTRSHLIEADIGRSRRWRLSGFSRPLAHRLSDKYAEIDQREQAQDRLLGYYLGMMDAANGFLQVPAGADPTTQFADRDGAVAWLTEERANLTGAVRMAAATGRDHVAIRLSLLLAEYLAQQNEYGELLVITKLGLEMARRRGDREVEADALNNLGGAQLAMKRFDDAVATLENALAIYRASEDRDGESDALNNLGLGLRYVLRLEDAIAAHEAAIVAYREINDRRGEGAALNNLALDLRESGQLEAAVHAHEAAITAYRAANDHLGETTAHGNLDATRALRAV
jgi:tetratricopeptide (TPR) repeat protein